MAGLADFLMGGAQVPNAYDPQLTPEANALAGAKPPTAAAPAPTGYQKPKGLRNTIGTIADVLAVLGGQQPMYSAGIRQQEKDFKAQQAEELAMQKQNVLGAYLADPSNPDLQKQAFQVAPLETFEIVTKLTPKPQNAGSVSDFQYVVRELQNQGVPPQEALAQARKILSTGQPALRTVPGVGLVDASDPGNPNVVMPSVAAPPAPRGGQVVTLGDGNTYLVDTVTGAKTPIGPAAPKGIGAAKPTREDQTAPEIVLPLITQARGLLEKASGSGLSSLTNKGLQFLGVSTDATKAQEALGVIGGRLTATSPRFEGPQGVLDVKLYEKMAGRVADDTLPVPDRLAALNELEAITRRNMARRGAAPAAPAGGLRPPAIGSVQGGYRYKGGDPAQRSSWEAVK